MKKNLHYSTGEYQTPVMTQTLLRVEGVLCASADSEQFGFVDDENGWDAN